MIKTIAHGINLVRHALRDIGTSKRRSSKWPALEKKFLAEHPTCAACGGKERLNVHHIVPFSSDQSLELDPNNLITLCMGKRECHLLLGHGDNFKYHNKNIKSDVAYVIEHPSEFDKIVKLAKSNRVPN